MFASCTTHFVGIVLAAIVNVCLLIPVKPGTFELVSRPRK